MMFHPRAFWALAAFVIVLGIAARGSDTPGQTTLGIVAVVAAQERVGHVVAADLERDHVLGSEPRFDADQARRALQEQSCGEQQHDRRADFDADQCLSQLDGLA